MPVNVKGIDKVNAKIASLSAYPKQQKQLIQAAGRRSLRPVVSAMRASIGSSNRTRTLYRSIGTKSARSTPTVIAGPRSGRSLQARGADGYYGRFFEKGFTHRSGKAVRGRNKLMPAARSKKASVANIYAEQIEQLFSKYARKVVEGR